MLTSLKRALRSSRSATTVAAVSLTLATVGVAGAATLPDEAADEAEVQVAENAQDDANDDRRQDVTENDIDTEDVTSEDDGPDDEASDVAHAVYDFISTWEGEKDCHFGLGVAATASGNEDLADRPCGEEVDVTSSTGEGGLNEANENAAVDVPADRGEDASDAGADNGPGLGSENNPGSDARSNAGGPPNNG